MEIWKDIPGYEGMYQASNNGQIKSLARTTIRKDGAANPLPERILKQCINTNGYYFLNLFKDGKAKNIRVHRLIAISFYGIQIGKEVNHKDGNKLNNCIDNLEWCTKSENGKHAHANKLNKGIHGSKHPMAKLTEEDVINIRKKYIPYKYGTYKLSEEYGVHATIIFHIIKGKRWNHV